MGIQKLICKDCDCFQRERFRNKYKFSNNDINKSILLLRQGVYSSMDEWETFNKAILSEKEAFSSNLHMEDTTDSNYNYAKRVCSYFEIKHLGEYHGLYLNSDILLLTDVFENFRKVCLEIYQLDPAKFLSASALTWQADFKKTKVELELLTDIDMLLMVEKIIKKVICDPIDIYGKANNKYIKDYGKNK